MNTELYRHFDNENTLLYVGISLSTFARLSQHKDHSQWFNKVSRVTIEHFPTREEAIAAEKKAIKTEEPKFNIAHKKTAREIEQEINEAIKEEKKAQQIQQCIHRYVQYKAVYTLDNVRDMLSMTRSELERHVKDGSLSTFVVEGRPSWKTQELKMKTMVSGWSLIDFIFYLESKNNDHH